MSKQVIFCWGNTVNGELGLGGIEEEQILSPRELSIASVVSPVIQIACGEFHTVILLEDGSVYSCGSNDVGQLGHLKACKRPELVDGLTQQTVKQVVCGSRHTITLCDWGGLYSWGDNAHGQLGYVLNDSNSSVPRLVKSLATSNVVQVACGSGHCLALLNDGSLYSWGKNNYGQLGLGTRSESVCTPSVVESLANIAIVLLACGGNHSFVVTRMGAVYGWGRNSFGQLGLNDDNDRLKPTDLKALRSQRVRYISCGDDHTAVLTADGGVFTFGAGTYGQLGHGRLSNEILPRKILELMGCTVTQISCGRRHTVVYEPRRGRVYTFGQGGSGQLGTKATTNHTTPVAIRGPWVTSLEECKQPVLDNSSRSNTVRRIFCGGDRSFVLLVQASNSVIPDDLRRFTERGQITTMEMTMADNCASVPEGEACSSELIEYVETVFGSPACINASFVSGGDEVYAATRENAAVDLAQAKQFFKRLGEIKKVSLTELILERIRQEMIPGLVTSPLDKEALRVYLIIFQCGFFDQPIHHSILCSPFGKAILSLSSQAASVLDSWLGLLEQGDFLRLITIYKNCVVQVLETTHSNVARREREDAEGLLVAVRVLDRLNTVNKGSGQLVPYEVFYIPEVTELIDVRVDYINWLQYMSVDHSDVLPSDRLFLCNYPFLFDGKAKTLILQTDAVLQMQDAMNEANRRTLTSLFFPVDPANPYLVLVVTRENLVQDSLGQLMQLEPRDLKKPLCVVFHGEDAVDGGGVRKEFFMLLFKEVIDPKYGMFKEYEETGCIWFNEKTFESEGMFNLIGLLCGLAIYNANIINLPFPLALYKKLLGETVRLDDIRGLSPTLHQGLHQLLDYDGSDCEDTFMLKFEISMEAFGEVQSYELKPDGRLISVTSENRQEYVDLYVDFILNKVVEKQYHAFHAGFHKVCGGPVLQLFHARELMAMVVGNENYDWHELEKNAEYKGVYSASHPTIKLLWSVFHELTLEQKKKFLLFLTGYDRIPIFGMKSLKIVIQSTGGGEEYLPVAHTCFNLLDLPTYTDKITLKEKLLLAIEHTQGFALV